MKDHRAIRDQAILFVPYFFGMVGWARILLDPKLLPENPPLDISLSLHISSSRQPRSGHGNRPGAQAGRNLALARGLCYFRDD
jgi:hypothetical protein